LEKEKKNSNLPKEDDNCPHCAYDENEEIWV
jgi:hypothetical protein